MKKESRFKCEKCGERDETMRKHNSTFCTLCYAVGTREERLTFNTTRLTNRKERRWDMKLAAKWLGIKLGL